MEKCFVSYDEIRAGLADASRLLCIVGYGNHERRDDGAGPWVVKQLRRQAVPSPRVRLLIRPQLEFDLLEELGPAGVVILVDASVERLEHGISWARVDPQKWQAPFLTHSMEPGFFLSLLGAVHQRLPATWLVSIRGEDFGHGQGLSGPTLERARQVTADLVKIIAEEVKS